jgi:hypothetical protein
MPLLPESQKQSGVRVEAKAKERRVVGKGDDAVIIKDTLSDDDDEETL